MPVSRALRCLFVHIPKTGGTSVEVALGMHGDWAVENRDSLFGTIRSADLVGRGYLSRFLQHLTLDEVRQLSPECGELFSFSFVRNPWDRMVSSYCNPDPDMLDGARASGVELTGLDFPEFVRRTEAVEHIHLLPQHRFVTDRQRGIAVNSLGRFETLEADFESLCRALQVEARLPHENASEHIHYREYHTDETRDAVARRYRQDIDLFDYRF